MTANEEKLQIVTFSTNDTSDTPNEILNIFLSQHTHSILKQSRHAYAFQTELPGTNKQTKIMVCSVLDLQREYPGIKEVNCYIMFIDFNKEESFQLFNDMIVYFREYCNLSKKIYVIGLKDEKNTVVLKEEDFTGKLKDNELIYQFKYMNLDNKDDVESIFLEILNFCLKNPIKGPATVQRDQGDRSCNIF